MEMELTVKRMFKTYKNRKLNIYNKNGKLVAAAIPWSGWYTLTHVPDEDLRKKCRKIVLENFYWLLGKDMSYEDWVEHVNGWDSGKHVYGVPVNILSGMFFDGEKEIVLNSFNH